MVEPRRTGDGGAQVPMVVGALRHDDTSEWYQGQEEKTVNLMRKVSTTRRDRVDSGEVKGGGEVRFTTVELFRGSSRQVSVRTKWPTRW